MKIRCGKECKGKSKEEEESIPLPPYNTFTSKNC